MIKSNPGTEAVFRISSKGDVYADKSYHGQEFVSGKADLAETVKITEQVEAGDVLCLNPLNRNGYRKCRDSYSSLVSGVVSSEPGIVLSSETRHSKAPLALMGRVPVKATAENGPINPGDLLTTSSKTGYAMLCQDRKKCTGAIVGKAIDSLEEGKGKIKMLVVN